MVASSCYKSRIMAVVSGCGGLLVDLLNSRIDLEPFSERGLTYPCREVYNLKAIFILGLGQDTDLWLQRRSSGFHFTCCSAIGCDKDEARGLRLEVSFATEYVAILLTVVELTTWMVSW